MTGIPDFQGAKTYILKRQEEGLSPNLYYHSLRHVLDVYAAAKRIALEENINESDSILIKTAALYHDCGYMISETEHEKASCAIAKESLPLFGYSSQAIKVICNIILATMIPQKPKTLLEEIVCDADLDYLGRSDFYSIGNLLYKELLEKNSIKNKAEWDKRQLQFLKAHTYFTKTSKRNREPQKREYVKQLTNYKSNNL